MKSDIVDVTLARDDDKADEIFFSGFPDFRFDLVLFLICVLLYTFQVQWMRGNLKKHEVDDHAVIVIVTRD